MNFIDFPTSPTWAAAYAEQGLTPPLPAGFQVDRPARFEPLPIRDLNEREWAEQGEGLLRLIAWAQLMANTERPDVWHNHLPGPGTPATKVTAPVTVTKPVTTTRKVQEEKQQPTPINTGGWKAL